MRCNRLLVTLAVVTASSFGPLLAEAATSPAQVQYEKQKAECMSGKSNQDQATCLKEAGAALSDSKSGNLNDNGADYRKNQLDRCKALSGSDQTDCFARMKGSGTVSGSVGGGGILREQKTSTTVNPGGVVIAPQAAPPLPAPVTASGPK